MTTKANILAALRRENLSVTQLCKQLGVTRNAINLQLKQLQADGLVLALGAKRNGQLGKPALIYQAAPHSEDVASRAYQPFLADLLNVMSDQVQPDVFTDLLEKTGRRMAHNAGLSQPANFEAGLRAAMAAADRLGASTEASLQENGVTMVRNYSCPLGTVVRNQPCVCHAIAAFFSEATGRAVTEQCLRDERLTCQYLIEPV
ncbi:ArsR family transcriptional regulator [Alcaligenaceae bacterium]|nr:ArsR family transcriptional regulator [Alcaligenaceae bacterium]